MAITESRTRKTALGPVTVLSIAAVLMVGSYLVYDLMRRWIDPCAGLYDRSRAAATTSVQTATKVGSQVGLGPAAIEQLSDANTKLALQLAGCCTMARQGLLAAQKCIDGGEVAVAAAAKLTTTLDKIEPASSTAPAQAADAVNENVKRLLNATDVITSVASKAIM